MTDDERDAAASLFAPLPVRGRTARNRVVHAPMSVCYADEQGYVTPTEVDHYGRRARGGVGMVITENFAISDDGRQLPKQTMVSDERYLPGLRRLAEAITSQGALAVMQIVHAGRYAGPWDEYDARPRWAPSARPFPLTPTRVVTPTEISETGIVRAIEDFAAAAALAERAGWDGVEIHGAQGFLISQFLSPRMNLRADRWGGDVDGRLRFALEVTRAVRAAVSDDFIVGFHLLADELLDGGFPVEEGVELATRLEREGVDLIVPVVATFEALQQPVNRGLMSQSQFQMPQVELIKNRVSVPVVANGRLGDPLEAARIIRDGRADAVGLARPLLADPDWAAKTARGDLDMIRRCPCDPPLCIRTQLGGVRCHSWPEETRQPGSQYPAAADRVPLTGAIPHPFDDRINERT